MARAKYDLPELWLKAERAHSERVKKCPLCETGEWRLGTLANLPLVSQADERIASSNPAPPIWQEQLAKGLSVLTFTCKNCGFVALHDIETLLGAEDAR